MGLQVKPAYIGTSGFQNSVENDRNILEHAFTRSGVTRPSGFVLTNVVGAMTAQMTSGAFIILGGAATQGAYFGWSDATENIAWPASAGSARYDTVIARVIDTQYGADAAGDLCRWEVLTGTPGGSPVPLTDTEINTNFPHPGAWMRMYDVLVPASATNLNSATFTKKYGYCNAMGFTPCLSTARPTLALENGEAIYQIDDKRTFRWDSATSAWLLDRPDAFWTDISGQANLVIAAGGGLSLGSGGNYLLQSRYRRLAEKLIMQQFAMTFGSTGPANGTGNYQVAAPTAHPISTVGDGLVANYGDNCGGITSIKGATVRGGFIRRVFGSTTKFEAWDSQGGGFIAGGAGTWPNGNWGVSDSFIASWVFNSSA
jgi:hypothetical protein